MATQAAPTVIPPESEILTAITSTISDSDKVILQQEFMPRLAGRYKITSVLASGGFAYTYLAEDTQRPSAPICLVKQLQPARQDSTFLEVARRMFHNEAKILEKLGNYPQIPQLLAHFEENEQFYLVEEFIPGNLLSEELKIDERLEEGKVMTILKEILSILVYLHAHGVIHRDIKPNNIIRSSKDGRLVLIDFGAVKEIQPQQQDLTIAIGTRGYTPPEQLAGQPDFSSDIYAVGMIVIQALTGIPPAKLSVDKTSGNINWREFTSVGEELAVIIDKMVRYHFGDRYQSATSVLKDLENLL
ncbi:MAG: serine/threonine protein kinase, partial [Moorea sp. SIO2B7]|nr:serine/threonine protein kinase [Moorena sp. SIO2B7]